jgi:hypothetical protein
MLHPLCTLRCNPNVSNISASTPIHPCGRARPPSGPSRHKQLLTLHDTTTRASEGATYSEI